MQAKDSGPWRIYVQGSFSGLMPFIAKGTLDIVKPMVDKINSSGGINGRKLELVVQDDKAILTIAATMAKEAINDPNHLLTIGSPFSSIALPISKIYEKNSKIYVTAYATNPKIAEVGPHVFQLCFTDNFQAKVLAQLTYEKLKPKKVLVLKNESDPYSSGLSDEYIKNMKKHSSIELSELSYIFDNIDYKNIVAKIEAKKPDLIFLPELKMRAAEILPSLLNNLETSPIFLGADGWGSEKGTLDIFYSNLKPSKKANFLYTYHWHPEIPSSKNKDTIKQFSAMNVKAYGPAVHSYDFLQILFQYMKKEKSLEFDKLIKHLRSGSFEVSTGKIRFPLNKPTQRDLVLLKLTPKGIQFVEKKGFE